MDRVTDIHNMQGRWIIAPRKGAQFLGPQGRARMRARARRRRVFFVLLEAIGFTFLMGMFPPLRAMWVVTAGLGGLFALYVFLLMAIQSSSGGEVRRVPDDFRGALRARTQVPARTKLAALPAVANGIVYVNPDGQTNGNGNGHGHGYAPIERPAEAQRAVVNGRSVRAVYNGLEIIESEEVHVVVRSARQLQTAAR
jgi:hypothetical protein